MLERHYQSLGNPIFLGISLGVLFLSIRASTWGRKESDMTERLN